MALHLHVAERTDALADGLADLLATPLDDPFAPEVIAVPTRGMERWLTQRLSSALGAQAGLQHRAGIVEQGVVGAVVGLRRIALRRQAVGGRDVQQALAQPAERGFGEVGTARDVEQRVSEVHRSVVRAEQVGQPRALRRRGS